MPETWYVLEDDSVADPQHVLADKDGALRHASGAAVKMRSPGVPMTRSVDADKERAKREIAGAQRTTRELRPEETPSRYRTRGMENRG
jgi:hypothetical protein